MSEKLTPKMYVAYVLVIAIVLAQLWLKFFIYLEEGEVWGHKNYLKLDVGVYLLLAILVVATPAFLMVAWRSRPKRWRSR